MTIRPIRLIGDPVLRTPCDPIRKVTDGTRALVQDLLDTVDDEARAGVAANQIGVSLRRMVRSSGTSPLSLVATNHSCTSPSHSACVAGRP